MSKVFKIFFVLILLSSIIMGQDLPFSKGVGFNQAFEKPNAKKINIQQYTRQDFKDIKRLGCDAVRLFIDMKNMVLEENNQLDPLYFFLLDHMVDIAEEEGVHLILANMSGFDYKNDPTVKDQLISIWTQMAEHYKNRSDKIYYEIANEPSNISDSSWNIMQKDVIDAIRKIDQKHTIIVCPANWSLVGNLQYMAEYEDDNLIYTFHFYDPFYFTHQGAAWASLDNLQGVPFPYDSTRMPDVPPQFIGSWEEWAYRDYKYNGTAEKVRELIGMAGQFKQERNVPLWCGEFGVYDKYSDDAERTYWYEIVGEEFRKYDIGWSVMGYRDGFAIYEKGTNSLFDHDLHSGVINALGLTMPTQSEYTLQPERNDVIIYDDFVSPRIDTWASCNECDINLFSEEDSKDGRFSLKFGDVPLWSLIDFRFRPIKDFSILVNEGYVLDFWIKGDTPTAKFMIRFDDSKTDDPNDHPWRMVHNIDQSIVPINNEWQHVQIPLSDFYEQGSYDDGWFDPVGAFDWGAIESFKIMTEYHGFEGINFWFDKIQIVKVFKADFIADVNLGKPPFSVKFNDCSEGVITEWFWDFGDGNTSNEQNPSHTYEKQGLYTVSLTVKGPSEGKTVIKEDYILVSLDQSGNMFHNGDFSDGINSWETYLHSNTQTNYNTNNQAFNIEITNGGDSDWNVQLLQKGISIQKDKIYTVSFDASSTKNESIGLNFSEDGGSFTEYGGAAFSLTNEIKNYSFSFKMEHTTNDNARFVVNMGNTIQNLVFDNFVLTEAITEMNLNLISPNGGETFKAGDQIEIAWHKTNVAEVVLEFSADNGNNWEEISASPLSNLTFNWKIPEISSDKCLLRVKSTYDNTIDDICDAPFKIMNPVIQISSPVSGTVWNEKESMEIKWTCSDIANIKILYSNDDGTSWNLISNNTDALSHSYNWEIPEAASENCFIKLINIADTTIFDVSDKFVIDKAVSVEDETVPDEFHLSQNYPNPFNPSTQIKFSVVESGHVTLLIYDMLGRKIATLVNTRKESGYYTVKFNADNLPSGIYIYHIKINDFVDSKKMILMK